MNGSNINRTTPNIMLNTSVIKRVSGIPLSEEEQKLEDSLVRSHR